MLLRNAIITKQRIKACTDQLSLREITHCTIDTVSVKIKEK